MHKYLYQDYCHKIGSVIVVISSETIWGTFLRNVQLNQLGPKVLFDINWKKLTTAYIDVTAIIPDMLSTLYDKNMVHEQSSYIDYTLPLPEGIFIFLCSSNQYSEFSSFEAKLIHLFLVYKLQTLSHNICPKVLLKQAS